MYTLGINAAFHDSAACIVKDGLVLAAAEEERFTGIKHAKRPVPFSAYELPYHAIDYCLKAADICLADVDHVAYSFDPGLAASGGTPDRSIALPLSPSAEEPVIPGESVWHPLFLSYVVNAPRQLADGSPHHLKKRFRDCGPGGPYRWHNVEHHAAHAASAFLVSPFEEAAVMTIDGRGESLTTAYAAGRGNSMVFMGGVHMPHSLGLLYERITSHLGFLHSCDEYKVMALASFGRPSFYGLFRDAIRMGDDGTYLILPLDLEREFGPAREKGGSLEQRHCDIACSLQVVLEETVLELARWLHAKTGMDSLCLAGGVALNCVMNSVLRDRGPFRRIWIQPASGDAGTALGAAVLVDAQERKTAERGYRMDHVYLGPSYTEQEIESFLRRSALSYRRMYDMPGQIADLLVRDAVVGWFQGRMEFGPRSLGARSILASPLKSSMQARLNEIKDREDFRPVAPVVLEEEAADWFAGAGASPFMLFVHRIREGKKSVIPAVCHIDGTARIQTVNAVQNPDYYGLLQAFRNRSGVPVLVNTSFNTRGKPIVCTPRDAIECFYTSPIDALAIGPFLLQKPGV